MFCNMLDLFPSQIQWQFSCSALIQTQPSIAPASKIYIETWDTNNRQRSLPNYGMMPILLLLLSRNYVWRRLSCPTGPTEVSHPSLLEMALHTCALASEYQPRGLNTTINLPLHHFYLCQKKIHYRNFFTRKFFFVCLFSSSQGICGWDLKSTAENPTSEDATPSLSLQDHKFPVDRRRIWYHSIIEYNSFFCLTSDRKGCDIFRCGNGDKVWCLIIYNSNKEDYIHIKHLRKKKGKKNTG